MTDQTVSGPSEHSLQARRFIARAIEVIQFVCFVLGLAIPLVAQSVPTTPAYPLKVSANHRYLLDQNDTPFLIVGDSPQGLITDLTAAEAAVYFANRASYGFNAVQIHLLAKEAFGGRTDYSTVDGITPFTTPRDISTPNESYFARVDTVLRLAAQNGIVVFLTAAETQESLDLFRDNGEMKSFAFGQYLGNRYRNVDNIVWDYGNDFQTWRTATDNAVILAVAKGIKDTDTRHLHTAWLNFTLSASRDSPDWEALVDLDLVYTYFPTYAKILSEYALSPAMPVYLGESNYEEENNFGGPLASPAILRRQEFWAMTSGATGSFYGNKWIWQFLSGWQDHYDSTGAAQMSFYKNLFESRSWWKLVPDPLHQVLTNGYGTYEEFGDPSSVMASNDYATAALASDSSFMVAYFPSIRTVTVDMSKFSVPVVTARWYDPTNGTYSTIAGSPFAHIGSQQFTPSGNNNGGDGDWVLVIEPARPHDDFDGDGKSDIVWKHTDGSSAIWLMNFDSGISNGGLLGPGTNWSVKQVGDFNGDGKSDILWQNTDGSSAMWLMDGLNAISGGGLLGPGTGWSVQQVGDFNGDGKSDILWQRADGSSAIWLMDGLNVLNGGGGGLLGPGTGWSAQQIGDFDGDGKSDILWQRTDGSSAIWLMNGLSVTNGSGLLGSGTGWTVQQIGDFNGDGKSDILWQRTDGSSAIWLMNGLSVISGSGLLGAGTGWSVQQVRDSDGDGKCDILWNHVDGSVAIWLMNGLSVTNSGGLLGPGTGWSLAP
jgi:hypothetical protein